jgi:hypothetical protein
VSPAAPQSALICAPVLPTNKVEKMCSGGIGVEYSARAEGIHGAWDAPDNARLVFKKLCHMDGICSVVLTEFLGSVELLDQVQFS